MRLCVIKQHKKSAILRKIFTNSKKKIRKRGIFGIIIANQIPTYDCDGLYIIFIIAIIVTFMDAMIIGISVILKIMAAD